MGIRRAVVSIYSKGAYHSGDLDFVKASMLVTTLEETMNEIGFKQHGRHYVHPDCKHLFVEFPGGPPLGIGEDNSIIPDEVDINGTVIKILSPTGLDQAVLVAKNQDVNLSSIKKWCKNEKSEWAFDDFLNALKK